jgi:hypothetical protein
MVEVITSDLICDRVTTSIARFDPDVNWPSDLEFTLSPDVTTYTGVRVTAPSVHFRTPSSSFSVTQITSEMASALTVSED